MRACIASMQASLVASLLPILLAALVRSGEAATKQAWHITDVHIDIYYAEGTVPDHGCYATALAPLRAVHNPVWPAAKRQMLSAC